MNTPKTLPWLARTSGIALDRTEQLWNSASESARRITGESQSARYLGLAHDQMVALVEKEVLGANPVAVAPWLMIQAHLSVAPLVVANTFGKAVTALRSTLCKRIGLPANCA